MFLYHATKFKNLGGIVSEGLKPGIDGMIYFTTEAHHAVNWIDMTNIDGEDIICIEVHTDMLDESKIDDGYDHNPNFYKGITVKTYAGHIPPESLELDNILKYESRWKQ